MLDAISISVLDHHHHPHAISLSESSHPCHLTTVKTVDTSAMGIGITTPDVTTPPGGPRQSSYGLGNASYLQVIELVEVPAPPPRTRDAWESRYSSSYASSSSSGESSSRDSFVDSYCESDEDEEMSPKECDGGQSVDGTAGYQDEECDRIRLERVGAWLYNVVNSHDYMSEDKPSASASMGLLPIRLPTNYVCSACDREFAGLDGFIGLRTHAAEGVEEACRGAALYSLEPASLPSHSKFNHLDGDEYGARNRMDIMTASMTHP